MKLLRVLFVAAVVIGIVGTSRSAGHAQDDDMMGGYHVHFADVWFSIADQTATLSIHNDGDFDVVLSDWCSPAAPDGVTLFVGDEEVDSLTIAAGDVFDFAAAGAELEFEGLAAPLVLGDAVPLWLEFERADDDMGDMDDMDMDEDCDIIDDMDDMDDMSDMDDMDDMDGDYQEYLLGVPALEAAPPAVGFYVLSGWARPQAPITAAYVSFFNPTDEDVVIVGLSSPFVDTPELHTTTMDGDVMQMRPVENFTIPAGERFDLMPGGNHFMLINVNDADRFTEGLAVPLTLLLDDGTELTIAVTVLSAPFGGPMPDMGGMNMDHGDMAEGDMAEGDME